METVLLFKADDQKKIKEILDKEPYCRESFDIKEPKTLGFKEEGLYLYLKGDDKAINDLVNEIKDLAKKTEKEKEVLAKMKEDEESANVGMGLVFG